MHRLTAIAIIALSTGCTADRVNMEHEGTIWNDARGVAIQDDGNRIHMGMDWGTTCAFTLDGDFQEDHDFPTETDAIHDARDGAALGTSSVGLHFINFGLADVPMPSVVDAALTETGALALTNLSEQCEATWVDASGSTSVQLGNCAPSELDAVDGVAVVGAETGALMVDVDGTLTELPGRDQVKVDRLLDLVFSGATGEGRLAANNLDGSALWDVELPGGLVDIADMGDSGMVVASVEQGFGGGVIFLDAQTGDILDEIDLPGKVELATSETGGTMAVVGDWETHLYSVDRDGKGTRFYTSPRDAGLQTQPMGD